MRFAVLCVLALMGSPAFAQPKVDSDRLFFHLKETFPLPPGVDMKVGPFQKSDLPGIWKAVMTLSRGEQSQNRDLYVTEDGSRYFMAEVADLTKLPDEDNLAKLKVEGSPAKGPKDAKITVVEFTDFQCPYCKRAHEVIEENLFKTYGDRVRLVFKHFPLTGIHPWAEPASVAAACVQKLKPEAFWAYTDAVFKSQADIKPENYKEKLPALAAGVKVDKKKFASCFEKQETLAQVKKDVADGDAVGVNSTPSLFVNGHRMAGFGGFDSIKPLIDEMLAGTHSPPSLKEPPKEEPK